MINVIGAHSSTVVSSRALGTFINEKLASMVGRCGCEPRHACGKGRAKRVCGFQVFPFSKPSGHNTREQTAQSSVHSGLQHPSEWRPLLAGFSG